MASIVVPRGLLGSAQLTSNATTTSTTPVDVAGLTYTAAAGTRPLWIGLYALVSHSVAGKQVQVNILEDGTSVQQANFFSIASGNFVPITPWVIRSPTAGSHVYKVQWQLIDAGTGTMAGGSGLPAQLVVMEV